jgi:hypothetical protein
MGNHKIAILNIDSILNNFFWAEWGAKQFQNGLTCWIRLRDGCVRAKRKKQWLMVPSPFNPPFWSFEKKKIFYNIFLYNLLRASKNSLFSLISLFCFLKIRRSSEHSLQIQSFNWFASNLTKLWKIYAWRPSWFSPPFCFFLAPIFFKIDFNFQNKSLDFL